VAPIQYFLECSYKAYEYTQAGKISAAQGLYKFILEVDPKFISTYTNLGVLAEKKQRFGLAESYYRKAIEVDPGFSEAYYDLGVLYWRQKRWSDVVGMFEKTA